MLDDLDKELEQRGHRFCRYADDCNIYVNSRRSGERVLESVSGYVEGKLKLKVNRDKSAVGRPWTRFKKLMQFGIPEKRAAISACNGRGPWFNSKAPHMNQALRKKHFGNAGLFSLLDQLHQCRTKLV